MKIIEQLFERAFPGKATIGKSITNYWVILGPTGYPRWVIPKLSYIGLPVLQQWHPFSSTSKLKWSFFLTAYRLGLLNKIPNVKPVHLQHLDILTETSMPVFYIGTPSRVQKMVVTLVNPMTSVLKTVVKVPIGEHAATNIIHEANILHQLHHWKQKISPFLQDIDPETGISFQEIVTGNIAGSNLTHCHVQLLTSLQHDNKVTTLSEQLKIDQMKFDFSDFNDSETEIIKKMCRFLLDDTELPLFWEHGDFSPWNVLKTKDKLILIDWERSQKNSLPLLDLFHFLTMQRLIRNQPIIADISEHPMVSKYLYQSGITLSKKLLKKLLLYYFLMHCLNLHKESPQNAKVFFKNLQIYWEKSR